jgi:hypothetical protein
MLHVLVGSDEDVAALIEEIEQRSVFKTRCVDLLHRSHVMLGQVPAKGSRHTFIEDDPHRLSRRL